MSYALPVYLNGTRNGAPVFVQAILVALETTCRRKTYAGDASSVRTSPVRS